MNSFRKAIIFAVLLTAILSLALRANSPYFLVGVLFLPVSFLASLSAGAQSFMLARLPFLFINGAVLFFLLSGVDISRGLFLVINFAIIVSVMLAMEYFSSLYKTLPNMSRDDYKEIAPKYRNSRNLIFSFLYLTAFIWYADAFIIYSIMGFPFFLALVLIFAVTLLSTSLMMRIHSASHRGEKKPAPLALYGWTVGLVISQISWIIGFWPFGYLTVAFIITIIYYTISMILKEYLFKKLDSKRVARELLFAGSIIIVIFYFTHWLPL